MFKKKEEKKEFEEIYYGPVLIHMNLECDLRIMYHKSSKESNCRFSYSVDVYRDGEWFTHARRASLQETIGQLNVFHNLLHPKVEVKTNEN